MKNVCAVLLGMLCLGFMVGDASAFGCKGNGLFSRLKERRQERMQSRGSSGCSSASFSSGCSASFQAVNYSETKTVATAKRTMPPRVCECSADEPCQCVGQCTCAVLASTGPPRVPDEPPMTPEAASPFLYARR